MTVFDIEFQQGDWLVLTATVDKLHQVKVILQIVSVRCHI